MKKILLSILFIGLLLGARTAPADDAKPIAVVSFAGYDALMADIDCIGKLSGNADLAKMLEGMVAMQTQGRGLAGLDKSRPWGVVVLANGASMPSGYGFIPVTKLEDLLAILKDLGIEITDADDGVAEITTPDGQTVFIKQKGDWAYICIDEDGFNSVADDPAKLLGDAAKKYTLSARLSIKNIPAELREMGMGFLQMGMQAGMEKMPDESDETYDLRMKVSKDSIEQTKKVLEEMDSIFLGFAIDKKTGSAYFDMEQTAIAGTDSAKQMSAIKKGKTAFGGFYQPDAVLTLSQFVTLDKKQQEQLKNTMSLYRAMLAMTIDDQELDDDERAKAKQIMGDIVKVVQDTIASGKLDIAATVNLAPAKSTLIAAASVANAAAADRIVRELAAIAKVEHPESAKMFRLDAAEHDGLKFHTLSVPLPEEMENRDKLVALIGEELKVALAAGDKQIFVGVGDGAVDKIKTAIDKSKQGADKEVPPVRISLSATPVAKLVGDLAEDFTVKIAASSIASALESADGEDHVTLVGESVPNGIRYRLTLQKGILKILGMIPMMAGGM